MENAIFGGYSATEPDNHTEQFTSTPFAIGKVFDATETELTPGTIVPSGSEFVFEPDLSNPGIVEYLQQSLAAGHLGFFFSSLHEPLGHTGAAAYPDFYLDNTPGGPNPDGNGPTVELHVTILEDTLPGDYNDDGVVNAADFVVWRDSLGSSNLAADGDGNLTIDDDDYGVWRDNFGDSTQIGAASVPEPNAALLLAMALLSLVFGRSKVGNPPPRNSGKIRPRRLE